MTEAKYRTLRYKDHDWLKEEEYVAKNKGYMGALNYMVGKKSIKPFWINYILRRESKQQEQQFVEEN